MASKQPTSLAVTLARMFWILIGPAFLSIAAIAIAENHKGWFAPRSIAFLVVLALVIVARWLDPDTSDGAPITSSQLQKYFILTIVLGMAGWAAANMLGDYWQAT